MKTGVQVFLQSIPGMTDHEVLEQELAIALRAEELGFDYVLSPEHHFVNYSIAPDPLQFLTYVAAKTSRIGLVTGAVILPWNDPVRVAEKASLLDFMSDGRLVLGFGRGLARVEYETFGIDMGEARGRFDEAAPMIVDALRTGYMSGPGPFTRTRKRRSGRIRHGRSTGASFRSRAPRNPRSPPRRSAPGSSLSCRSRSRSTCRWSTSTAMPIASITVASRRCHGSLISPTCTKTRPRPSG